MINPGFLLCIYGKKICLALLGFSQLFINGGNDKAGAIPFFFKLYQCQACTVYYFLFEIFFGDHLIYIFQFDNVVSQQVPKKNNG